MNKIFSKVTFGCLLAVVIGFGIAALAVGGLHMAGQGEAEVEETGLLSSYAVQFPQNKNALDSMSAQMMTDPDVILALPEIAPAAGNADSGNNP